MSLGKSLFLCLAIAALLAAGSSPLGAQEKQPKKAKEEAVKPPPAEPKPFPATEPAHAPVVPYGVRPIPSLHYNYYYPGPDAGHPSQIPARLYLCPSPAPPPYVGYTYMTYPPFQPHEWLWEHARAYYRFHPGGGMTMTSMWWGYEER